MRILIVDDRMENRYLLETVLESEGYDTVSAENGQKALECLVSGTFDLIISDILMPVMDGFQLCRHCKADKTLQKIPFIFYTATYVDKKDEAFAYEVGADGFLRKGMEPADFLTSIHAVIKHTRQGRIPKDPPVHKSEEEIYKLYSERLVRKLEKKTYDLKENEDRYRNLIDVSPVGIAVHAGGKMVFSNRAEAALLGAAAPDDLIGKPIHEIIHPDNLDAARDRIQRMMAGEPGLYPVEDRYVRLDGTPVDVLVMATPLSYQGAPAVQEVVQDITEKKKAERELKIRNKIARIFLTTPGEAIYEKILALVLDMTESRYGIFGFIDDAGEWVCPSLTRDIWKKCQVPGKRIAFPHEAWTGIWGKAMTRKRCIYINRQFHLPEGHITIENALDAPVVYKDQLVGNLLIGQKKNGYTNDDQRLMEMVADQIAPVLKTRLKWDQEHKERRRAEIRLQQVQKLEAIGSLAGGIAHDFNNILSAILGYTQLAMDRLPSDSPVLADLKQVYKGGERAKDLVMQILAFSRPQEQDAAPIQISPIIKEVLKFLKSTLPSSIEIRQQIVPDAGIILADPTRIHQVLMNLCTNAAHAMDNTGGILTVALSSITLDTSMILDTSMTNALPDLVPGKYLRLTVGDTGHGITPNILPLIFDPYFTTKRRGEGTGLGLATAHGIIKSYGGGITVSSPPGKGTTFHVYFPVIEDPAKPAPEKQASAAAVGSDACILFVDDEPPIASLGKQLLEHLGYTADARTDPLDALALVKSNPDRFDLVITDLTMPGMKGDQLAEELMKIKPTLPVILCSGFSMNMTEKMMAESGIKAFIMKPLIKNKLADMIRQVLAANEA